jgi:hypothetical protein
MGMFKKRKKGNVGGILGVLAVGVGAAAAALLSNKKTRTTLKKAVSDVSKKTSASVKKVAKEVVKTEAKVAAKGGKTVKKVKVVRKSASKK